MFFIHTYSFIKGFKYASEVLSLIEYEGYKTHIITEKNKNGKIINKYAEDGVRLSIQFIPKEIQNFKKIAAYVEIIITPYKLLHAKQSMGRFRHLSEYEAAQMKTNEIINKIYEETGVDLTDAKIHRVDLTKDIVTPSQTYTREIIAALKVKHLPYGFEPMSLERILENHWNPGDAYLYKKENAHVTVKIYDKEQNLTNFNENTEFLNGKGLLRLELTLEEKALEALLDKKLNNEKIVKIIKCILDKKNELFYEYIIFPLSNGNFLSEDVLNKYLTSHITQEKKLEKMKECVLRCSHSKKLDICVNSDFMGSEKRTNKALEYFNEIDVSPTPLLNDCPYVPDIKDLICGEVNTKLFKFAVKKTRGKEYWSYGEYEL